MTILYKLILLFAGHALADYPLQGDFLARGKNRFLPLPGIPWYQCLFAHALIHAGMVLLITHSVWFALAEFVIHSVTDYAKCAGWFGLAIVKPREMGQDTWKPLSPQMKSMMGINRLTPFNIDQAIHYTCKILWAVL